jgi:hypothetical protein
MPFPRATPGQPLRMSASFHNTLADMADNYTPKPTGGQPPASDELPPGVVFVYNFHSETVRRGDALQITGPYTPPTQWDALYFRPVLIGGVPDTAATNLAILLEAAPPGGIARAVIQGTAIAVVTNVQANTLAAAPVDSSTMLEANDSGPIPVICKLGDNLALVSLKSSTKAGGDIAVLCQKTSGSNGSATAKPTIKYKIFDRTTGQELATEVEVKMARPMALVDAATIGYAYKDANGTYWLFWCDELVVSEVACA